MHRNRRRRRSLMQIIADELLKIVVGAIVAVLAAVIIRHMLERDLPKAFAPVLQQGEAITARDAQKPKRGNPRHLELRSPSDP